MMKLASSSGGRGLREMVMMIAYDCIARGVQIATVQHFLHQMRSRELEGVSILVGHSQWHKLILLNFNIEYLLSRNAVCKRSSRRKTFSSRMRSIRRLSILYWGCCSIQVQSSIRLSSGNINSQIVVYFCRHTHCLIHCSLTHCRLLSSAWSRRLNWTIIAFWLGYQWLRQRTFILVVAWLRLSLSEYISKWDLTFAILQLLCSYHGIVSVTLWLPSISLIISKARLLIICASLFNTTVLLSTDSLIIETIVERLFKGRCNAMETKPNSRLISWSGAHRLLSNDIILLLMRVLEHRKISWICSIFKRSNNWFLDSKFLYWIRRICGKSQLSNLRWVSLLWIWKTWGSSFLWT